MDDTDIGLMERIRNGDTDAFETLVARHQRSVFNLACRFLHDEGEAEDIAQEAFVRVYKAAPSYSPEAKFTTWLYTIVRNLCFNVIRKRQGADLVPIEDETIPELPSRTDDPLEVLEKKQINEKVREAVAALPENLRMAVILQKFYGMSYEEIAKVFGCSQNAVKLRVHRAKELLVRKLGGFDRENTGETN